MKNIIPIFLLMFSILMVNAQDLPVLYQNGENVTNQTITIATDDSSIALLQASIDVKNESAADMFLTVEKIVITEVEGTMNSMCFGSCVGPDVMAVSLRDPIPSGDFITFEGDYYHFYNEGTTTIKYLFTNPDMTDESCFVIVNFTFGASSVEDYLENLNLSIYPNPVVDNSSIAFDLPVNISNGYAYIYSLTGSIVKQYSACPGTNRVQINEGDLPSGVYLLSIVVDNKQLITQKIVVL